MWYLFKLPDGKFAAVQEKRLAGFFQERGPAVHAGTRLIAKHKHLNYLEKIIKSTGRKFKRTGHATTTIKQLGRPDAPAVKVNPDTEAGKRSMEIARTIIQQLGGNKFKVMTGAKDVFATKSGVQFKIGRNSSRTNFVTIDLTPADEYDMKFWRRHFSAKVAGAMVQDLLKEYSGIHFDQLRELFTRFTGMETSLGTLGNKPGEKKREGKNPGYQAKPAFRLLYFPANQAYGFVFGITAADSTIQKIGDFPRFFRTRDEAVKAAASIGIVVDRSGRIESVPNPWTFSIPKPREAWEELKKKGLKHYVKRGISEAKQAWKGTESNPKRFSK